MIDCLNMMCNCSSFHLGPFKAGLFSLEYTHTFIFYSEFAHMKWLIANICQYLPYTTYSIRQYRYHENNWHFPLSLLESNRGIIAYIRGNLNFRSQTTLFMLPYIVQQFLWLQNIFYHNVILFMSILIPRHMSQESTKPLCKYGGPIPLFSLLC